MAFPRFNSSGALTSETPGDWQKQWLDGSRTISHNGVNTLIDGVSTGQKSYNVLAAGAGTWFGSKQPGIYTSQGARLDPIGGDPFMDATGQLIYVRPFNADHREIVLVDNAGNTAVVVPARKFLSEARIEGSLITFKATGGLYACHNGTVTKVPSIDEDVFWPVPFFVAGEPWVLTTTHTGFVIRPIDSASGHRVDNGGHTFNPTVFVDAAATVIKVAFTKTQGRGLVVESFSFSAPRIDVRRKQPAAPPKPEPSPERRPEDMPTTIPNHLDVVKAARARYAAFAGPERAHLVVNAVAWELRDEGAGLFLKTGGTQFKQRSLDVIIYKEGETFDVLRDAEGKAEPQWSRTTPTGMGDPKNWRAAVDPATLASSSQAKPPLESSPASPPTQGASPTEGAPSVNVVAELKAIRSSLDALIAKLA
jgi:hypothetical protein